MDMRINPKKIIVLGVILIMLFMIVAIPQSLVLCTVKGDPPFSQNVKVNTGDGTFSQTGPCIAVDSGGKVYVAWKDPRNGNDDIYLANSTDGGANWSNPNIKVNTDTGSEDQNNPSIGVDSLGTVYAVWQDNRNNDWDIYFAKSMDGGVSWTHPNVRVSTDTNNRSQINPSIAVSSTGIIYAVWQDERNGDWDIFYAKSTNGGATWIGNKIINLDGTNTAQKNPTIAVDLTGTIYVAWEDQRHSSTDVDIYLTKSINGGNDWIYPDYRVNTDGSGKGQHNPTIDIGSTGIVYLAWEDNRGGNSDIYFAKSTDGGENWTDPNKKINSDIGDEHQFNPTLAVSLSGTIYVAWHDRRNSNYDIYFANSIDEGITWTHPNIKVDDDGSGFIQLNPTIAVSATGPIYVAWEDYRNGNNYDIYSASIAPTNAFPTADLLRVEGYLGSTPGIRHIINHLPEFSFVYNDPNSDPLAHYNVSLWDAGGSNLLWWYNITSDLPSGSDISLTYNTPPFPTNGPSLLDGTTYRLRVLVENTTGIYSPVSQVYFHLNEVLMPIPPISPLDDRLIVASETQTVTWTSPGRDAEGDSPVSFSWEVSMNPEFTTFIESGSGLVMESNSFDTRPTGIFYWRVNLTDGWETSSYGNQPDGFWNFTSYTPTGSNNPPIITNAAFAPTVVYVETSLLFTFIATDPDSDALTWSKISGPEWLSIGSSNGTIYGTPSSEELGTNNFTIQVSDGKGGTDNHIFTIEVEIPPKPNNPPTIINKESAPTKATINSTLTFTFTATDPDSDPLTWSKISGPGWLSIGVENGTIYGIPSIEDNGSNTFTIQVSDGRGGTDNHTFTIEVDSTSDEDDDDKDQEFSWVCLILLIILVIFLLLLLLLLRRRKREDEADKIPEKPEAPLPEKELPPPPSDEEYEPPPPEDEDLLPPDEDYEPPPPEDEDYEPPPPED